MVIKIRSGVEVSEIMEDLVSSLLTRDANPSQIIIGLRNGLQEPEFTNLLTIDERDEVLAHLDDISRILYKAELEQKTDTDNEISG